MRQCAWVCDQMDEGWPSVPEGHDTYKFILPGQDREHTKCEGRKNGVAKRNHFDDEAGVRERVRGEGG